jgi:PTH1 family peptidyl-tRNA hydrolase
MKLITFLGNPGNQYYYNRHNIGFLSAEYIAKKLNISINKNEFSSLSSKVTINTEQHILLLPQTFMNRSGDAVVRAAQFYKINAEDLIVVHDELELPFGEIRVKKGGGHKGHNGIRSIIERFSSADFYRIRIGIGRPENNISVASYVLSDFSNEEKNELLQVYAEVDKTIHEIILK